MEHEIDSTVKITINKSDFSMDSLSMKEYFPKEYKDSIYNSNVILIPYENVRKEYPNPVFPEKTMDFYQYLVNNSNENFRPEICIRDEEFAEIELHSDLIIFPLMFIQLIALPLSINLFTDYFADVRKNRNTPDINAKIELIVNEGEKSIHLKYEGDSKEIPKIIETCNKEFMGKKNADSE